MTDPSRLPAILRLLDDESPVVRERITEALAAMGEGLRGELARLGFGPDTPEHGAIRVLLEPHHRAWLRSEWPRWFGIPGDLDRLEEALRLLAEYQGGRLHPRPLGDLLDGLAAGYRAEHPVPGVRSLARYLFRTRGLRGAQDDYYDPRNSNLVEVVEAGRGIPISLVTVFILVGRRVGVPVQGCNIPAHFLARVQVDGETWLVDCFDGGRFILPEFFRPEFLPHTRPRPDFEVRYLLDADVPAEVIVGRVLNNLVRAFEARGRAEDRALMEELRKRLQDHLATAPPGPIGRASHA